MIRFSVNIMRGCFGGCTFCSITEHEGRIIQSRSEDSVLQRNRGDPRQDAGLHRRHLRPRRADRQHVPAWPARTARSRQPAAGRPASIPDICPNLNTDHAALIGLYRTARALPGVKKVLIGSGRALRPRASRSPEYVRGTGRAPRRRLPEDRARAHRGRAARRR
ncbi:MAG: hypothetical protein MZW92_21695 [Comamonadaceae bacterium]|nr:hypothetical protein [Comamonadaceae bacterium]